MLSPGCTRHLVDQQDVAYRHLLLASASANNRVHRSLALNRSGWSETAHTLEPCTQLARFRGAQIGGRTKGTIVPVRPVPRPNQPARRRHLRDGPRRTGAGDRPGRGCRRGPAGADRPRRRRPRRGLVRPGPRGVRGGLGAVDLRAQLDAAGSARSGSADGRLGVAAGSRLLGVGLRLDGLAARRLGGLGLGLAAAASSGPSRGHVLGRARGSAVARTACRSPSWRARRPCSSGRRPGSPRCGPRRSVRSPGPARLRCGPSPRRCRRRPAVAPRSRGSGPAERRGAAVDAASGRRRLARGLRLVDASVDRVGVDDDAAPAAVLAGLGEDLDEPRADPLAGHLDEAERGHLGDLVLRAVAAEALEQAADDEVAVALEDHVDEVDDDDPADVAQPELADDLLGRLDVVLGDRLLEVAARSR